MNHTTKMLMLAAVLGSWSGAIRAQEPSSRMNLDEALRLFVQNNPELRLAHTREAEAEGLARQANAFPNPAVAVTHEPLSRNGQNYSETYLNLTQRFPLPGERSARRDAAGWVLEAARARVLADSAGLFFEVKRAFVETGLAEVRLAMTERVAEVFRQGAQDAVIREAEGDISLYSLQRIRVEWVRYENFLAEAGLASAAAQRSLALLIFPGGEVYGNAETIRVAPLELLGVPPLELVLDRVLESAIDRRPELAAADAELEAARAGGRLARAERIPGHNGHRWIQAPVGRLQWCFPRFIRSPPHFRSTRRSRGDQRVTGPRFRGASRADSPAGAGRSTKSHRVLPTACNSVALFWRRISWAGIPISWRSPKWRTTLER